MHTDRLNKSAGIAQDMYVNATKGVPLAHQFGPTITDPKQFDMYTAGVRSQQGKALENILKILGTSAAIGGGIGLARGIPKLLKTREAIKKSPEETETEMAGIKAADVTEVGRSVGDVLGRVTSAVVGALHPVDATVGAVKGLGSALAESSATNSYSGIDASPMNAPAGHLPPGSLWPFAAAAVPLGAYGGVELAKWLTNSIRSKMLARKKQQVQEQFSKLLSGSDKSAGAILLEGMANEFDKQATIGAAVTGAGLTGAALLAALGFAGGRALGKKYNPDYTQRKDIEKALKTKVKGQPLTFQVEEPADGDYEAASAISPLAGDVYKLPMALPNRRKNMLDNPDESLMLNKLGSLRKLAGDPVAVQPKAPVATGTEQRLAARGGKFLPNTEGLPTNYATNLLTTLGSQGTQVLGAPFRFMGSQAAEGALGVARNTPEGKKVMELINEAPGALRNVGTAAGAVTNTANTIRGAVPGIADTINQAGKDFGAASKNVGTAAGQMGHTAEEAGKPIAYINEKARQFGDWISPLSNMLMSGLAGLPQMAANGINSFTGGSTGGVTPGATAGPKQPTTVPKSAPIAPQGTATTQAPAVAPSTPAAAPAAPPAVASNQPANRAAGQTNEGPAVKFTSGDARAITPGVIAQR